MSKIPPGISAPLTDVRDSTRYKSAPLTDVQSSTRCIYYLYPSTDDRSSTRYICTPLLMSEVPLGIYLPYSIGFQGLPRWPRDKDVRLESGRPGSHLVHTYTKGPMFKISSPGINPQHSTDVWVSTLYVPVQKHRCLKLHSV